MLCQTPSLLDFADSSDELFGLDYGFVMDNVEGLLSMRKANGANFQPFRYIPNPTVFAFEDIVKYTDGMKLEIMVKCQTLHCRNSVLQDFIIFLSFTEEKFVLSDCILFILVVLQLQHKKRIHYTFTHVAIFGLLI